MPFIYIRTAILFFFCLTTKTLYAQEADSTANAGSDSAAVKKVYMATPTMSAAAIQGALPAGEPSAESISANYTSEEACQTLISSLEPVKKASQYLVAYTFNEGDTAAALEYQKLDYKVRLFMVLAGNRLEDLRNEAIGKLVEQANTMTLNTIYDSATHTFLNTQYIDDLKNKIFFSQTPPTIQTHSIGINYPSIKALGISPKQGAKGYRLPLGKNYALFILDLQYDGKKAIIWDSTAQKFIAAR